MLYPMLNYLHPLRLRDFKAVEKLNTVKSVLFVGDNVRGYSQHFLVRGDVISMVAGSISLIKVKQMLVCMFVGMYIRGQGLLSLSLSLRAEVDSKNSDFLSPSL